MTSANTPVAVVQSEYTAPDGSVLACINQGEADFMWHKVYDESEYGKTIDAPPGSTVVDVGVNIGLFCRFAASSGHKVIGFEPVPYVANCARINAPSATIVETPISDADDVKIEIDFLPHYTMLSGRRAADNEKLYGKAAEGTERAADIKRGFSESIRIPCVTKTLTSALKEAGVSGPIGYLKIDCEMMEDRVLAGMDQDLWDRVQQIVIEVHDIENRIDSTLALLESKGFKATKTDCLPPSYLLKEQAKAQVVSGLDACLVSGIRV